MKALRLNTLHRYVGIAIAPFMVIQTVSGLLLDFGLFRGGAEMGKQGTPVSRGLWDLLLIKVHFGAGWLNDAYHLLLGAGIIWMALSGWILYLRVRRARRKPAASNATGEQVSGATRP